MFQPKTNSTFDWANSQSANNVLFKPDFLKDLLGPEIKGPYRPPQQQTKTLMVDASTQTDPHPFSELTVGHKLTVSQKKSLKWTRKPQLTIGSESNGNPSSAHCDTVSANSEEVTVRPLDDVLGNCEQESLSSSSSSSFDGEASEDYKVFAEINNISTEDISTEDSTSIDDDDNSSNNDDNLSIDDNTSAEGSISMEDSVSAEASASAEDSVQEAAVAPRPAWSATWASTRRNPRNLKGPWRGANAPRDFGHSSRWSSLKPSGKGRNSKRPWVPATQMAKQMDRFEIQAQRDNNNSTPNFWALFDEADYRAQDHFLSCLPEVREKVQLSVEQRLTQHGLETINNTSRYLMAAVTLQMRDMETPLSTVSTFEDPDLSGYDLDKQATAKIQELSEKERIGLKMTLMGFSDLKNPSAMVMHLCKNKSLMRKSVDEATRRRESPNARSDFQRTIHCR